MSAKHKSASPSASQSPSPKRKQQKAISNEGKLDTINMCVIKVYTLLVSAVPTVHGSAGKIEDSTESVTPASIKPFNTATVTIVRLSPCLLILSPISISNTGMTSTTSFLEPSHPACTI
jgi:hypothetical protein